MNEELKRYMKVNLQLFAEPDDDEQVDEEIGDGGYVGGDDEDEQNENKPDDEKSDEGKEIPDEEDSEVEEKAPEKKEQPKTQKDKKDYAIIKAKQESKKLRDELAKYKQAEEDLKAEHQKEQLKKKYVDSGYTEEEAAERAEEKSRVERLERELKSFKYDRQAEKLSQRFPDIYENLDKLVDICEKTGWPLEKVAKTELEESSEYDIKTKTEAEALLRRQKAAEKKVVTGSSKEQKQTKLSTQDERTYQNMIKAPRYRSLTRQQYLEILKDDEE